MVAVDLNRGRTIFAYRPNALLNPASVVKLFTGAAALHYLKPEYRFESTVWLKPEQLSSGVLNGNLYIKGGGDPTLVTERLWLWVTEAHHLGLREVKGDLIIDESFFDQERVGPGFDMENTDFAYMAPVGAMSVNFNAVGVHIRPGRNLAPLRWCRWSPIPPTSNSTERSPRAEGWAVLDGRLEGGGEQGAPSAQGARLDRRRPEPEGDLEKG